eukprot:591349-Prymnesium_polylepis.1
MRCTTPLPRTALTGRRVWSRGSLTPCLSEPPSRAAHERPAPTKTSWAHVEIALTPLVAPEPALRTA